MLNYIFERASVYDGSGKAPYVADVATFGDRIVLIGELSQHDAFERIPCSGLALAPGFIDIHSHSDENWLIDEAAAGKITQGVTTEIGGNCGSSIAPLYGYARERKSAEAKRIGIEVGVVLIRWVLSGSRTCGCRAQRCIACRTWHDARLHRRPYGPPSGTRRASRASTSRARSDR